MKKLIKGFISIILIVCMLFTTSIEILAESKVTLSNVKLSKTEAKKFKSIINKQSKLEVVTPESGITLENINDLSDKYTIYDQFFICKLGDTNALVLYSSDISYILNATFGTYIKIYYIDNGKLKSKVIEETRLSIDGYSDKYNSLNCSWANGSHGNLQVTIKNGQVKFLNALVEEGYDDIYYFHIDKMADSNYNDYRSSKKNKISEVKFSKLYNKYYKKTKEITYYKSSKKNANKIIAN